MLVYTSALSQVLSLKDSVLLSRGFPHCCVLEQTLICSTGSAVLALTFDLPLEGVIIEEDIPSRGEAGGKDS